MTEACVETLTRRFQSARSATAFIDEGTHFTYDWVLQQLPLYETFFEQKGMAEGEALAVVADYSPKFFCFLMAAISRRLIVAPLTQQSVVERETVVSVSQAQWFLEFHDEIEKIVVERTNQTVSHPMLLGLAECGEPGLLLFSSGSTGKPKAILHSFRKILAKFETPRPPVVAISFLMLDHFGGINTMFHITSSLGTLVTVKDRSVSSIARAIEQHRVEVLPTTPSFLNLLVHSDVASRFDLSSLQTISYGTEVMPQATLNRLSKLFPTVKLQQTYGLSEVGVLRSKSRPDGSLWVSIGGSGFETKVVNEILWIRSEFAMLGYLNAPSPFDAEGWFNTQDRVETEGEWFRILGRVTDLINVGGQKVYPSEIEDVIIQLENVEDVSVSSEPHALLGNIIVAQVRLLSPEAADALKTRIRIACAGALAPFKVPSKVLIAQGTLHSVRHKKVRV